MRVIVIDDDHDAVRTLSTLLEMKGITVEAKGYDGKEAVQLFREHQPEVVLLDMMMPEFDGNYAIKKLKQEDANVKIIVLTAYRPDYDFEKRDVAAVFDKPYKITDVIHAMAN